MPSWKQRRERFRAALEGDACVHPASVHDPIAARLAEDLGFELGMFAGSTASLTVLGAPDLILLTLTEFASQACRISRASELPILADADHGYGNALNVLRTVEELEAAGVSGLSIENTELPRPYGRGAGPSLVSLEEGAAKVAAALAARSDTELVIAGRTGAPGFAGIEETIARARAYEAAGADAIFLVGLKSREDLEAISAETSLPLIIGGAGPGLDDTAYLAGQRVRICLQGHQPFAAAVQAIYATLKALREGTPPNALTDLATAELMAAVSRRDRHEDWIKRYLG